MSKSFLLFHLQSHVCLLYSIHERAIVEMLDYTSNLKHFIGYTDFTQAGTISKVGFWFHELIYHMPLFFQSPKK